MLSNFHQYFVCVYLCIFIKNKFLTLSFQSPARREHRLWREVSGASRRPSLYHCNGWRGLDPTAWPAAAPHVLRILRWAFQVASTVGCTNDNGQQTLPIDSLYIYYFFIIMNWVFCISSWIHILHSESCLLTSVCVVKPSYVHILTTNSKGFKTCQSIVMNSMMPFFFFYFFFSQGKKVLSAFTEPRCISGTTLKCSVPWPSQPLCLCHFPPLIQAALFWSLVGQSRHKP